MRPSTRLMATTSAALMAVALAHGGILLAQGGAPHAAAPTHAAPGAAPHGTSSADPHAAPAGATQTAPAAATQTAPAATTQTAPGATTQTAPGATTQTAPGATTQTAPGATTQTPATTPPPIEPPREAREGGKGEGKGGKGGKGRDAGPTPVRVAPAVRKVSARNVAIISMLGGRRQADVYSKVTGRISALGPAEGEKIKQGEVLFRVDRSDPGESYLNTPVVSPLSGWVGRWSVNNVGEQVTAADPVVTVVDDTALRAVVNLPASDWLLVKRDTKVVAELGGASRAATIQTIAVSADPASGRGSVTIEIPNGKRDWRVGMFATVTLALEPKERMLLNATSLTITDRGTFVYVVGGDTARRLPVKYAVIDSDTVEILEGLQENALVITAGGNLIGDGSPIKVLQPGAIPPAPAPEPKAESR